MSHKTSLYPGDVVIIQRGATVRNVHNNLEFWSEKDQIGLIISKTQQYVEFDELMLSSFCIVFLNNQLCLICDRFLHHITSNQVQNINYRVYDDY